MQSINCLHVDLLPFRDRVFFNYEIFPRELLPHLRVGRRAASAICALVRVEKLGNILEKAIIFFIALSVGSLRGDDRPE